MLEGIEAHCPRCDGDRDCKLHGSVNVPFDWTDGTNRMFGESEHKLLQCLGCKFVFYFRSTWDSEDWDNSYHPTTGEEVITYPRTVVTFPSPEKKSEKPDWVWNIAKIDAKLSSVLNETYHAHEEGLFILASVGLRTALDRTTELLNIHPGHTLEEKVKKLLEEGYTGETEAKLLQVVVEAGSAAIHRAWSPSQTEFQALLITLEQFLYRTLISGKSALTVAEKIPPRHPRPPKTKPV